MKNIFKFVMLFILLQSTLTTNAYPLNYSFTTMSNTTESFSKFEGTPLLVDTFASWCGGCIEAFPHLKEMLEYRGSILHLLSLDVYEGDSVADVQKIIDKNAITWEVGLDTAKDFQSAHLVPNLPQYFLFATNGSLLHSFGAEEASSSVDYIKIIDKYIPNTLTSMPSDNRVGDVYKALADNLLLVGSIFGLVVLYVALVILRKVKSRSV